MSSVGLPERRDRRSANPLSSVRAPPKKGGAGGRFTFGCVTDPDQDGPAILDTGDPNYELLADPESDPEINASTGQELECPVDVGRDRNVQNLNPALPMARKGWLPEAGGHHLFFDPSVRVACARCEKGAPHVFSFCSLCGLCARCCVSKAVLDCPGRANGGTLHQHALEYSTSSQRHCTVDGPTCLRIVGKQGWVCTDRRCQFFACDACAAAALPSCFVRSGRTYDQNQPNDQIEAVPFDVHAAEMRAAVAWELQDDPDEGRGTFVGMGDVSAARPPRRRSGGKDSEGNGSASGALRSVCAAVPPAPSLDRHLSEQSKKALHAFAQYGGANADLAIAEEFLAYSSIPDQFTDVERDELRAAITAGELGVAAQFYMGARLASRHYTSDVDNANVVERNDVRQECPLCLQSIVDSRAKGNLVGCLNGHGLHAACASDLALSGAACPACRAPLFYANVSRTAEKHVLAKFDEEEQRASCNFSIGDIVMVHPDVVRCSNVQALPASGGWNEDMIPACGTQGVVVATAAVSGRRQQHVEVRHDWTPAGAFTWCWHSTLLMLVCAFPSQDELPNATTGGSDTEDKSHASRVECVATDGATIVLRLNELGRIELWKNGQIEASSLTNLRIARRFNLEDISSVILNLEGTSSVDPANTWIIDIAYNDDIAARVAGLQEKAEPSSAVGVGERVVCNLRQELAKLKKAREEVRDATARFLGITLADTKGESAFPATNESASSSKCESAPSFPVVLSRALTRGSAQAVLDLGMTVSPVDMQRARHLLGIARQWGESDVAKRKRSLLHDMVRAGDLDSVARTIRQYNTLARVQHALWSDAGRKTCSYRVSSRARVELLAHPGHGAQRAGFALQPGVEFVSTREVMDSMGCHWVRVGNVNASTDAFKKDVLKMKATLKPGQIDGARVEFADMPAAIGSRVMRGPDWENDEYTNGNDDGGHGCFGTIIDYGEPADEMIKVKWDTGTQKEYWGGAKENGMFWELAYAGPRACAPAFQGWLCVRPSGPGGPPVVSAISAMLRCFKCGGEMPRPFQGDKDAFEQASTANMKVGDSVLVAATMEQVLVEKIIEIDESVDPLVVCRYTRPWATTFLYDSSVTSADDEDNHVVFRTSDLVRPNQDHTAVDESLQDTCDLRLYEGAMRSRREFVMMHGSLESAKMRWREVDEAPLDYASCIRGHFVHARCFQDCLFAGLGCPLCQEPLFVPSVQRENLHDEGSCCANSDTNNVDARMNIESGDASNRSEDIDDVCLQVLDNSNLKMCPLCFCGPLLNENCDDMAAHHGECPQCENHPFTDSELADAVARTSTLNGGVHIPRCPQCSTALFFNGCRECGCLFTGKRWYDLPDWDPQATVDLRASKRYLRAARLLAAEVRMEAARLAHERIALNELQQGIDVLIDLAFDDKPPLLTEASREKASDCK